MPQSLYDLTTQDRPPLPQVSTSSSTKNRRRLGVFDSSPSSSSSSSSPSSSSSSLSPIDDSHHPRGLPSLRLNRPLLAAHHRAGSSTPIISWDLFDTCFNDDPHCPVRGDKRVIFSARKLAATIWDLQHLATSGRQPLTKNRRNTRTVHQSQLPERDISPAVSCVSHRSHRSSIRNQKVRNCPCDIIEAADSHTQVSGQRHTTARIRQLATSDASLGEPLGGVSSSFVKVLNWISSLKEKNISSMHMVSAILAELNHASEQVQELLREQKLYSKVLKKLTKGLTNKNIMWPEEKQENARDSISSMTEERQVERNSKRRLERRYREAEQELLQVYSVLAKTRKDLGKERRARELMEIACDELAREVAEDKARAEEFRREISQRMEQEELKMVQMAKIWQDERGQMKVVNAWIELEEKSTALAKLRAALQTFLKAKRACDSTNGGADHNRNRSLVYSGQLDQTRIKAWSSDDSARADKQSVQEPDGSDSIFLRHLQHTLKIQDKDSICTDWDHIQHAKSKSRSSTDRKIVIFDGEQLHGGQGLQKATGNQYHADLDSMNGSCLSETFG